jgi:DNA-binding GntR family transcriptional regulator
MMVKPSIVFSIQNLQTRPAAVTEALRGAILDGRLAAGGRLIQEQLARELRVSRTPLREALRALEAEGLVVCRPFHGWTVARLSLQELEQVYALRLTCEGLAARLASIPRAGAWPAAHSNIRAASRHEGLGRHLAVHELNRRFHLDLGKRAGGAELSGIITRLWNICEGYRRRYLLPMRRVSGAEAIQYHEEILSAVEQEDADRAERAMREHLLSSAQALINALEPGYHSDLLDNVVGFNV